MTAASRVAYQTLENLVGRVARETAQLQKQPLTAYSTARRPVRLGCHLDRCSSPMHPPVHCGMRTEELRALCSPASRCISSLSGTRFKDDKNGSQQLLARDLAFIEHLLCHHTAPVTLTATEGSATVNVYFEHFLVADFANVRYRMFSVWLPRYFSALLA
eukprot:3100109-Pleurochrysis_carterae.AAC.2